MSYALYKSEIGERNWQHFSIPSSPKKRGNWPCVGGPIHSVSNNKQPGLSVNGGSLHFRLEEGSRRVFLPFIVKGREERTKKKNTFFFSLKEDDVILAVMFIDIKGGGIAWVRLRKPATGARNFCWRPGNAENVSTRTRCESLAIKLGEKKRTYVEKQKKDYNVVRQRRRDKCVGVHHRPWSIWPTHLEEKEEGEENSSGILTEPSVSPFTQSSLDF